MPILTEVQVVMEVGEQQPIAKTLVITGNDIESAFGLSKQRQTYGTNENH